MCPQEKSSKRQTNKNLNTNESVDKDKMPTAKEELSLKDKEFVICESLLTQLSNSNHLGAYKNILTLFGIFFCLQTISSDYRNFKK